MFVWNRHILLILGVSVEDRQTAWLKMTFGGIHRIDSLCYSHLFEMNQPAITLSVFISSDKKNKYFNENQDMLVQLVLHNIIKDE